MAQKNIKIGKLAKRSNVSAGYTSMRATEQQQQDRKADVSQGEITAHLDTKVLSELAQNSLRNGTEKGEKESQRTVENTKMDVTGEDTELRDKLDDKAEKEICSEGSTTLLESELAAGDYEKEIGEKR